MSGAAAHKRITGSAACSARGRASDTAASPAAASVGLDTMLIRNDRAPSRFAAPAARAVLAAVCHSSSRRRVTEMRTSVRTIACVISNAW